MRTPTRLGLGAAALSLVAGATGAWAETTTTPPYVPNTPKTEVFLTCSEPSKEYTVGRLVNEDEGTAGWSTDKPASVTTGAGCGKVDDAVLNGANTESLYNYSLRGTYEGNLDVLTVTLHSSDIGLARALDEAQGLEVRATVDGKSLFGSTTQTAAGTGDTYEIPNAAVVPIQATPTGSTGAVRAFTFSITGIDLMLESDDTLHEVFLEVAAEYADSSAVHTWLWGAAEAPSGIVFTPDTVAPSKIKANKRSTRK